MRLVKPATAFAKRMPVLRLPFLGSVAAMFLAQPCLAQKVRAQTPWILLPSALQKDAVITVKQGDPVMVSRAVPALLAALDDDLIGRDGNVVNAAPRVLAAKGQQLFGVVAENHQVTFCVTDSKPTGVGEGIFVINADKHLCMIDTDRDGKFDHSFDLRTKNETTIPIYDHMETVGNPIAEPVSYHLIDSKLYAKSYEFRIVLEKASAIKGVAHFIAQFGSAEFYATLIQDVKLKSNITTQPVNFLDSQLKIRTLNEKSAEIVVEHGIAEQSFVLGVPPPARYIVFY